MPPMYTQRKRLRSALQRHGAVKFPRDSDDPFGHRFQQATYVTYMTRAMNATTMGRI